ncbi:F-box/LRR-repeat protein [Corchorus olitorius]|uniref:F-box/LRR-repeat protein n=1 Tax=Corchorus olitorius TaxID=93759 RepID=A0A1R3KKL4_9ROSI|nr:F-box/LRR-repeat protein [Corchorus olitorius]
MPKLLEPAAGAENLSSDCWQSVFDHRNQRHLKAVSLASKDFLTNSNLVKKRFNVIHPDVKVLSQHLKRFTQVKEINVSRFQGDLNEAIREVAPLWTNS